MARARAQVPVLVVDGEQLNDSAFIMLALKAKLQPSRRRAPDFASPEEERWFRRATRRTAPARGADARSRAAAATTRRWVNGRFVHVLTPNLYRTPGEAKQAFDYITTARARRAGARPQRAASLPTRRRGEPPTAVLARVTRRLRRATSASWSGKLHAGLARA